MRIIVKVAAFAAVLAMLGCGGGGNGNPPTTGGLTKQSVVALLGQGMKNSESIRNGNGEGGEPPVRSRVDGEFYFEETLNLWVQDVFPSDTDPAGTPRGSLYYEDEAKTKPAGHNLFTLPQPGVWPEVYREETEYLAGTLAGYREVMEWRANEDGSGSSTGEGSAAGHGSWEFTGSWGPDRLSHFTQRFEGVDGSWQEYDYQEMAEGASRVVMTSSQGVTFTLNFSGDFSGNGTITGTAEGLPATITWDINGDGAIAWADGTTTAINIYDLGA